MRELPESLPRSSGYVFPSPHSKGRLVDVRVSFNAARTAEGRREWFGMIQARVEGLKRGDRVLVRYGRFAGRIGEVEEVFRSEDDGRERDVVWVRFGDRSVEGFDPKNLMKKGDNG